MLHQWGSLLPDIPLTNLDENASDLGDPRRIQVEKEEEEGRGKVWKVAAGGARVRFGYSV